MKWIALALIVLVISQIFNLYEEYQKSKTEYLNYTKIFNQWTNDCLELGGTTVYFKSEVIGIPDKYECVVNKEIIVVKGYEHY